MLFYSDDKGENSRTNSGYNFKARYRNCAEEVHRAKKLVSVSDLYSQDVKGQMVTELNRAGFSDVDQKRRDLSELDHMFVVLATTGDWFEVKVQRQVKTKVEIHGLLSIALGKLNLKDDEEKKKWDC